MKSNLVKTTALGLAPGGRGSARMGDSEPPYGMLTEGQRELDKVWDEVFDKGINQSLLTSAARKIKYLVDD